MSSFLELADPKAYGFEKLFAKKLFASGKTFYPSPLGAEKTLK